MEHKERRERRDSRAIPEMLVSKVTRAYKEIRDRLVRRATLDRKVS
jgi:hypothetical protein